MFRCSDILFRNNTLGPRPGRPQFDQLRGYEVKIVRFDLVKRIAHLKIVRKPPRQSWHSQKLELGQQLTYPLSWIDEVYFDKVANGLPDLR